MLECLESSWGRAVRGFSEKKGLCSFNVTESLNSGTSPRTPNPNLQFGSGLHRALVLFWGEWKEETGGQVSAGSCKHVSTSHTVPALCQRRQQEKNELKLWLACGRGWGIVRRGWLCYWKEEMSVCGWRREGKRGERERFPKLIKCSEGRKLPASIPVPLDKFARRSLQFLCSAEVASWGQLRGRGSGGWAMHSKPFCAVGSSQPSEAAQLIICFWNYKQELQISHKFAWLSFALYSKRPATVFVWGVFCAFVPLIWKKGPIVYVLSVNSPGMRKVHLLLI